MSRRAYLLEIKKYMENIKQNINLNKIKMINRKKSFQGIKLSDKYLYKI